MIHEDERAHHSSKPERQYSLYREKRTDGSFSGFYDDVEHKGELRIRN
jgi:hypothetical protein